MDTVYSSVITLLSKYHFMMIMEFCETLRARKCEAQNSSAELFHVIHVVGVYLTTHEAKPPNPFIPQGYDFLRTWLAICMMFRLNVCDIVKKVYILFISWCTDMCQMQSECENKFFESCSAIDQLY